MDFEPCAFRQVQLLLRLNEGKTALVKAIDSGDTDLVHIVIQHLKEHMSLSDFLVSTFNPLKLVLNLMLYSISTT
jgi:vacuolar protein sorting-associated protein 16